MSTISTKIKIGEGVERATFTTSVFLKFRESPTRTSVLLVHHKRFNMWLPVGGELEHGEMPFHGAVREVSEETGIPADDLIWVENPMPCSPPGFIGYEEHDAGNRGVHKLVNFIFQAWSKTKAVKMCEEHFEWLTKDEVDAAALAMPPNVYYCLRTYIFLR